MSVNNNISSWRSNLTATTLQAVIRELKSKGIGPSQASVAIGRARSWLTSMQKNKGSPSAVDLLMLAQTYDIPLMRLFDIPNPIARSSKEMLGDLYTQTKSHHGFDRPNILEVVKHCMSTGGSMTYESPYIEYVDVYEPPDKETGQPVPIRVGSQSLSSKTLAETVEDLRHIYTLAEKDVLMEVINAHIAVISKNEPVLDRKSLAFAAGPGVRIEMIYDRLLVPMTNPQGRLCVGNYSRPHRRVEILEEVPEHEVNPNDLEDPRSVFQKTDTMV